MFGWLARKSQNSRVYMCTKVLKTELEDASALRRAVILALAQDCRMKSLVGPEWAEMLDHPQDFRREQCMSAYESIELSRNQAKLGYKQLKRSGLKLPQSLDRHLTDMQRGAEVWMVTIGGAVCPDLVDDVSIIWRYMLDAEPHLIDAMKYVNKTDLILGQSATFPMPDDWQLWESLLTFTPQIPALTK